MIRKISALLAGVLLCSLASSQSVPNGGTITTGQVWTVPQWINAWQSKFDVTGGSLTAPTITNPAITGGTQSAPTITSPTISGGTLSAPTITGTVAGSPTWTGNQIFSAGSGNSVIVNQSSTNSAAEVVQGGSTASQSQGLIINAGTGSADHAFVINDHSNVTQFFDVRGDGGVVLGAATGGDEGLGTINARDIFKNNSIVPAVNQSPTWTGNHTFSPASGVALALNGSAGNQIGIFNGTAGNSYFDYQRSGTLIGRIGSADAVFGGATTDFALSTPAGGLNIATGGVSTLRMTINSNGNVAIAAPSSGVTIAAALATPSVTNDRGVTFANPGVGDARVAITTASAGNAQLNLDTFGVQNWALGNVRSDGSFRISSSQTLGTTSDRFVIASSGSVTINAPSGGTAFSVTGAAGNTIALFDGVGAASGVTFRRSGTSIGDEGSGDFIVSSGSSSDFGITSRSGALVLGSNATTRVTISNPGNVLIAAPSSGIGLTVNGVAGDYANKINGNSSTGNSFGQLIQAGTTAADAAFNIVNAAGTSQYFLVYGNGGVIVGSPTGGNLGAGNLNMQGCFINAVACNAAGSLTGTTLASGVVNSSLTSVGAITSGSFPAANLSGTTLASNVVNSSLTSVGAVTSGSFPAANLSGSTLASGVTASSLTSLGTLGSLAVSGAITNNSQVIGSPTGGNKGPGTINAQAVFVNGAVSIPATGSFTATGVGFTTSPTVTAHYSIMGTSVTLAIPTISGTSNSNNFGISGLPTLIQPASRWEIATGGIAWEDNSVGLSGIFVTASAVGSVIVFNKSGNPNIWTPSGVKGSPNTVLVYDLN